MAPAQRLQVMVTPSPKMWNMGRAAIVTSYKNQHQKYKVK